MKREVEAWVIVDNETGDIMDYGDGMYEVYSVESEAQFNNSEYLDRKVVPCTITIPDKKKVKR